MRIPIEPNLPLVTCQLLSRAFVARVAAAHPDELTVEHSAVARRGRVYLDPFRNGFGQTVVASYSVRRREKAPISTPLEW